MSKNEKIELLKIDLEKTINQKMNLKKTTREHYNVINLLIEFYEKEIQKLQNEFKLSA